MGGGNAAARIDGRGETLAREALTVAARAKAPGARSAERSISARRLASQQIASPACRTPAEVVAHLTAMQAQDYRAALWSIGLRLPNATVTDVERAITNREIVRTWPMRGTLHFVAAADVRWMLQLLAPRVVKGMAGRRRQLGLDDDTVARSRKAFAKALRNGRSLTRDEMRAVLARAGIEGSGARGYHVFAQLAQEGFLCFGAHREKQPTFTLLEEWLPPSPVIERDEALALLASRYFRGHGPATERDLMWWSGLGLREVREAIALAETSLAQEKIGGTIYHVARSRTDASKSSRALFLLPAFDELLLGYTDRSATLDPEHARRVVPGGNGVFKPTIVSNGRVIGTWSVRRAKNALTVEPSSLAALTRTEARAFHAAAARYERFALAPPSTRP